MVGDSKEMAVELLPLKQRGLIYIFLSPGEKIILTFPYTTEDW
jgi:hypothetical protein